MLSILLLDLSDFRSHIYFLESKFAIIRYDF